MYTWFTTCPFQFTLDSQHSISKSNLIFTCHRLVTWITPEFRWPHLNSSEQNPCKNQCFWWSPESHLNLTWIPPESHLKFKIVWTWIKVYFIMIWIQSILISTYINIINTHMWYHMYITYVCTTLPCVSGCHTQLWVLGCVSECHVAWPHCLAHPVHMCHHPHPASTIPQLYSQVCVMTWHSWVWKRLPCIVFSCTLSLG